MFFYYENFEKAQEEMDENPDSFVRLCFRKGDPSGAGLPSFNASIRKNNGWFELMGGIPDVSLVPIDTDLISEDEASIYAKYLKKNTFFVTASLKVRAKRRFEELRNFKKKLSYSEVLKSIKKRDKSDYNRRISPLKKTKDSILLNTSNLSKKACFLKIKKIIDNKLIY